MAMPESSLSDTPQGRLQQVIELLRLHIVDTREAHMLCGGSEETAPPAGTYVDLPDDDACPCCGRSVEELCEEHEG